MTISVTNFKTNCLRILRELEHSNEVVEISKQGKVRFRVISVREPEHPPWKRLQQSAFLSSKPGESVLSDEDFHAN